MESIEKALGVKASNANPLIECELKDKATSKTIIKLGTGENVSELSGDEFSRVLDCNGEGVVGSYHPKTGRIFMIKGEWCFSNLIHEVLHSKSVFSKKPPQSNLEFVYEGITELLVGIVLKRSLNDCYQKWANTDSCFLRKYEKFVKPWYYLALKSDLKPVISLYFDVKENEPLKELGKLLQKSFDNDFEKLFTQYNPADRKFFQNFVDKLGTVYSPDFSEFQGTRLTKINLDQLQLV